MTNYAKKDFSEVKEKLALRERVKELTCLYEISQLAGQYDRDLKDILSDIACVVPRAWQYPEFACARIIMNGEQYASPEFKESNYKQKAEISVNGINRGHIEVIYKKKTPKLDEGPFMKEERKLINSVAKQIGFIIERKEAYEETKILQEQLRHADRLATIGQFAAGVAHELNEPLGNILGFAQIVEKSEDLPKGNRKDILHIVKASLHAREIVRKLLIFGRQVSVRKIPVNLNNTVKESTYFLKTRCEKDGIKLKCKLSKGLPRIYGDPAHITQVIVNLTVNAIQAMPQGGKLLIETKKSGTNVLLAVEDNGTGMPEHVKEKIFMPFFTTKDVGQGTGLGLPVVHGIVISHGGSIEVESKLNHGTRFVINFPGE
ncbi:MAG: hypothetical protein A2017_16220 [Lentisphaerae bacterium GWF2_44_16]|nr:MAG: hypothetical protein A2017_16220 [Lentisphaerae bacterium GWF2_44_16]